MTTNQASDTFNIDVRKIQNLAKDGMIIGAAKVKGKWNIPDDTSIIPSKEEIIHFLFQILKFKNNDSVTFSRSLCPDDDKLRVVMDYVYRRGFIGEYHFSENIREMLSNVSITDEGFNFIFGSRSELLNINILPITVNPKLSILSIG